MGVVGTILSGGSLAEGGLTVAGVIALANSLDDAFGAFTKGEGSLSQGLTPDEYDWIPNSLKLLGSGVSLTLTGKSLISSKPSENAWGITGFGFDLTNTVRSVSSTGTKTDNSDETQKEDEN